MAGSKQASLILKLIDEVSGPARGIAAALGAVDRSIASFASFASGPTRALASAGRNMRRQAGEMASLSAGLSLGIGKMAKDVYDLEKQLNISVAAGGISLIERTGLLDYAVELNSQYAATSAEIVAGTNELLKAGMKYEQSIGLIAGVLDTAQAMDVPIAEASAAVVNSMTALRMEMETTDQAMMSSKKIADLYAHAVNETTASLDDLRTSGKYFNPVAAAMGMSPEEATAWQIALAKAGIMGSSAGTGLRSAPISVAAPSKKSREAMAALGIDPSQFVGRRTGPASGSSIAAALEAAGFSVEGIEDAIDQILANPALQGSSAKLAAGIIETLGDELGVATAEDRIELSTILTDALNRGVAEIDLAGFLKALRDQGAGIAEFAAIFGKQHASKMLAIDPEAFDQILADVLAKADGTARRMREAMMSGIVGDVAELTAAIDKMSTAVGKAGILSEVATAIADTAKAISDLADSNPELLRFGAYATLAIAAAAPLGFAISGIASSLAFMVNPLTAVVAGLGYLAYQNWDGLVAFGEGFKLGFLDNLDQNAIAAFEHLATSIGGWVKDINVALSDTEGMSANGNWFGATIAREINAFVRDIQALKAEWTALEAWWKGEGASPVQIQTSDGVMGQFWRDLGSQSTGDFLRNYLVPDAWKPEGVEAALREAQALANASGEARNNMENLDARPIVDTSSIDAAILKAEQLRRALAVAGSAPASSAPPPIAGARAEGGPVRRGLSYIVGEEGPELFTPGASGGITPNHSLGGGGIVQNNTFNVTGADPKTIAGEIGRMIDRQLDRSRQISIDGRPVLT